MGTLRARGPFTVALLAAVAGLPACSGDRSEGLGAARNTGGPRIVWDIEHKPLPEIPLPNDVATRLDPDSATGRRVNVSLEATTRFESDLRRRFDALDGFGTFSPISVSFDRPLALAPLTARHANDDFRDDAVFLLNVDPRCKRYGEEIALDVGRGRFPITMQKHAQPDADPAHPQDDGNRLFEFDPSRTYGNLLFEERNEDANGNGALDPGEDLDGDGTLDVANLDDPRACDGLADGSVERDRCIADHLLTFYERESNTLVLRPVWPLEQRCVHAVVLTNRLVGEDGRAVESPLPAINPRDQTRALEPISALLPRYGLSLADVAFTWSFTTGSMTDTLETIRKGLYGVGTLSRLSTEYPVDSLTLIPPAPGASTYYPGGCANESISYYWQEGIKEYGPNMCAFAADNTAIGGLVYGTFPVPNFVVDKTDNATPHYPNDAGETFDLDTRTGRATYGTADVTFWCSFPKKLDTSCSPGNPEGKPFCAPFPTVVYAHGYGSSRGEITSYMGRQASMGIASCALDSPGHGGNIILKKAGLGLVVASKYGIPNFGEVLFKGRDRDLDNDGDPDPGGDIYSANLFHTRDMLTQASLEFMQFVRIMRAMDGRKGKDGTVLGDFDGDGTPDMGGPAATIGLWGISMGGLITGILGGAEPAVDATVPISGGAGLTDATLRSTVGGLPTMVFLPIIGPFLAGYRHDETGKPYPDGEIALGFLAGNVQERARVDLGRISGVAPGDRVELANVDKGISAQAWVSAEGTFRVSVAADALDALERRPLLVGPKNDESIDPPVAISDTPRLGDRLAFRVFDGKTGAAKSLVHTGSGKALAQVDTFLADTAFQGTLYPAGAPLVAIQKGLGYRRNTPQFRRFLGIAQNIVDPVDAATWSQFYFEDRLDTSYDPNAWPGRNHVLVVPTSGDMVVPMNTAIATARTAGILGSWRRDETVPAENGWRRLFVPDPRFGVSLDRYLVDTHVLENVWRLERQRGKSKCPTANFDIDDLGDGNAQFKCAAAGADGDALACETGEVGTFTLPRGGDGKGMRATHARSDGSFDAMRIPYLHPHGQHGLYNAQRNRIWDADAHGVNLVSLFMATRGRVTDVASACDCSASLIPTFEFQGKEVSFGEPGEVCDNKALVQIRVCSAECAASLSMQSQPKVLCP